MSYGHFRQSLLAGAIALMLSICLYGSIASAEATVRSRVDGCAPSHGAYCDPEYTDPYGDCLEDMTSGDFYTAMNAINEFGGVCSNESDWLTGQADLYEWTGNWFEGYEWNAFTDGNVVAIQWPYMDDAWLWAHEGAHGAWGASESEARARADECLQVS